MRKMLTSKLGSKRKRSTVPTPPRMDTSLPSKTKDAALEGQSVDLSREDVAEDRKSGLFSDHTRVDEESDASEDSEKFSDIAESTTSAFPSQVPYVFSKEIVPVEQTPRKSFQQKPEAACATEGIVSGIRQRVTHASAGPTERRSCQASSTLTTGGEFSDCDVDQENEGSSAMNHEKYPLLKIAEGLFEAIKINWRSVMFVLFVLAWNIFLLKSLHSVQNEMVSLKSNCESVKLQISNAPTATPSPLNSISCVTCPPVVQAQPANEGVERSLKIMMHKFEQFSKKFKAHRRQTIAKSWFLLKSICSNTKNLTRLNESFSQISANIVSRLQSDIAALGTTVKKTEGDLNSLWKKGRRLFFKTRGLQLKTATLRSGVNAVRSTQYGMSNNVTSLQSKNAVLEQAVRSVTRQFELLQYNQKVHHEEVKTDSTNFKLISGVFVLMIFGAIHSIIQRLRRSTTPMSATASAAQVREYRFGHHYNSPPVRGPAEPGLCVVSFSKETGRSVQQLLRHIEAQHLQGLHIQQRCVSLSSHEDIPNIPPSRLCLLVVNADARGLVLERHSDMRGDFRISTLNYALERGCDVMLMVYGESRARELPPQRLYLSEYDEVYGLEPLQQLIAANKFLTIQHRFSDAQARRVAEWIQARI